MKEYFVNDLNKSIGLFGESVFALSKLAKKTTKAGKPYIDVKLKDRTGEIVAKVWSDNLDNVDSVQVGDAVNVGFEVKEYQSRAELVLQSMHKTEEYDIDDLMEGLDDSELDQLVQEFRRRIDSVRDYHLKLLLDSFVEDKKWWDSFISIPAGSYIHHSQKHGLLSHCLEMMSVADGVIKHYPDVNRDLVIVGIVLHDVGKMYENEVSLTGVASRTFEGKLVGHIGIGLKLIQDKMPADFPESLRVQLEHIVMSHHGKLEYGSPVVPATREAMLVHLADYTSTYMNIMNNSWREGRDNLGPSGQEKLVDLFGEYNKYLGTSVFVG